MRNFPVNYREIISEEKKGIGAYEQANPSSKWFVVVKGSSFPGRLSYF